MVIVVQSLSINLFYNKEVTVTHNYRIEKENNKISKLLKKNKNEKYPYPMPVLLLLSGDGLLCGFPALHTHAASVTNPPPRAMGQPRPGWPIALAKANSGPGGGSSPHAWYAIVQIPSTFFITVFFNAIVLSYTFVYFLKKFFIQ